MSHVLVAGLCNVETSLRIPGFPLDYAPVYYPFHGVGSAVSGVGFNVAAAMTALGDEVRFLSLGGDDVFRPAVEEALEDAGLDGRWMRWDLAETPQSVILYDGAGRRQIHVDLKDVQERAYPESLFLEALEGCRLAVLCNVEFARPFLRLARERGIPVATDVHAVSDLADPYDGDFMAAADVLFMSDEALPCEAEAWLGAVMAHHGPRWAVVGMGARGALLADRDGAGTLHLPAVTTRPVVNTIGAGDALFSAFCHFLLRGRTSREALDLARVFASWKIGVRAASQGFLDEAALEELQRRVAREGGGR